MRRIAMVVLALIGTAEAAIIAARAYTEPVLAQVQAGTLVVESNPNGVQVVIDGIVRGATPLRLSLKPGAYTVELRGRGLARVIPVTMSAGSQVSQYLEMPEAEGTGQLEVRSEPAGARVTVDGRLRGVAPLAIPDLPAGQHEVLVESEAGSMRQSVLIQAGSTAALVMPLASTSAPMLGWVTVAAPFEMQVLEGGHHVGTTNGDRIMMQAGRHTLEIASDTVGFRTTRDIQVRPGKVVAVSLDLPKGTIHLNATPWAEVWMDGQRLGETPLGNLTVAIGPHEFIFRHPQLGEKRYAATVSVTGATRVSLDLRK